MATVADIETFVYAALQTDTDDLPQTVVFAFINEITGRFLDAKNDWPHLYQEGTLSVVAGDRQYVLASASFNPQTFVSIQTVWDDSNDGFALSEMDFQQAESYWIGTNQSTENPRWFSVYNGNLNLYPTPASTVAMRVGGYRAPALVDASSDTPDIPAAFHYALMLNVVSFGQAQQDDYEAAAYWQQLADISFGRALKNHFSTTTNRPIVLHGRDFQPTLSYEHWMRRMVP